MILLVSRVAVYHDHVVNCRTHLYHEKYSAPCYRVEYANSDRIKWFNKWIPKNKTTCLSNSVTDIAPNIPPSPEKKNWRNYLRLVSIYDLLTTDCECNVMYIFRYSISVKHKLIYRIVKKTPKHYIIAKTIIHGLICLNTYGRIRKNYWDSR